MCTPNRTHGFETAAIEVPSFRKRCIENGYKLVRIGSNSKQPAGKQWQRGEAAEQLLAAEPGALNTGILSAGLRCFDVDVDDAQVTADIKQKILARWPGALVRMRANSFRFAVLVRAADGAPVKRSIAGLRGKLEVLGAGQQFVAHGVHPSGALIEWEGGRGPDTVPRDQLPPVTEEQVEQLLTECAVLLGSDISSTGPGAASYIFEQPGPPPSVALKLAGPIVNDLGAGIESRNGLMVSPQQKKRR